MVLCLRFIWIKNSCIYLKRQKAIEQELGCEFIRIDPDKEDFDIFNAISEIFRHIKQLSNKLTRKVWWIKFQ